MLSFIFWTYYPWTKTNKEHRPLKRSYFLNSAAKKKNEKLPLCLAMCSDNNWITFFVIKCGVQLAELISLYFRVSLYVSGCLYACLFLSVKLKEVSTFECDMLFVVTWCPLESTGGSFRSSHMLCGWLPVNGLPCTGILLSQKPQEARESPALSAVPHLKRRCLSIPFSLSTCWCESIAADGALSPEGQALPAHATTVQCCVRLTT